jgi:hypothetical protein
MCHVACQEQEPLPILAWTIGSNVSRQRLHHRSRNRDGAVFIGLVYCSTYTSESFWLTTTRPKLISSGADRAAEQGVAAPHRVMAHSSAQLADPVIYARRSDLAGRPIRPRRQDMQPCPDPVRMRMGAGDASGGEPTAVIFTKSCFTKFARQIASATKVAFDLGVAVRCLPGARRSVPPCKRSHRCLPELSPGSAAPTRRADISGSPQDPPPRPGQHVPE